MLHKSSLLNDLVEKWREDDDCSALEYAERLRCADELTAALSPAELGGVMDDMTKLERGPMVGRMLEGDFEKDTITFHMPATYYLASGRYIIEPESDWVRRKEQLTALSARASAGEGVPHWNWLGLLGALVCEAKDSDRSTAEHHAAIDKAHKELFDWMNAALTPPSPGAAK